MLEHTAASTNRISIQYISFLARKTRACCVLGAPSEAKRWCHLRKPPAADAEHHL